MKLYIKKIKKDSIEQTQYSEGKILLDRSQFSLSEPIKIGDIYIFFEPITNQCYYSLLEKIDSILTFIVLENAFCPNLISIEKNTTLLIDTDSLNEANLFQEYYPKLVAVFRSAYALRTLNDFNEVDLYYKINSSSNSVVLNNKRDKSDENIKSKSTVYFVFLFDKVLSVDSNGIIKQDFEKFVSCDLSSLVYWFDENYIYVSRKESGGHKIYYKIVKDTISPQFNKLLRSLSANNKTFFQFSTESYFLQEYIISRKETNFSNLNEKFLLEELFIIIKKYFADNDVFILQHYNELNSNHRPSVKELSLFVSPIIRDVYIYLLSKGFDKRSVLNCIKELSPNVYSSEIKKIENMLSTEEDHLHNLPQD